MNEQVKKIASIVGAIAALTSGAAMAESTYGYDNTVPPGTQGAVTATAKLDIRVNIPKLILLRVGSSGADVDVATLTAKIDTGIPGGIANPLSNGSDQATGWNGSAPVFEAASSANVRAWAWTNAAGGGKVTAAVTTDFDTAASGLLPADITVASTALSGGGLDHPGLNTGALVATPFARNTVVSSNWVFSATPAVLAARAAGSYTQRMTYTATSL